MAQGKRKMEDPKNTGQFGKGNPGKPKGATNKMTRQLKDMILGALDDAGGQKYLAEQAIANPSAFLTLVGKVLPITLNGTGDNGEIVVTWQK